MQIQRNMAAVIRAIKETSGKSITEFSSELEISRSALQDYLSGKGNPSMSTIDHLAEKLGVDASFLISGVFSQDQVMVLLKLLDLTQFLSGLSPVQRVRFSELLVEMLALLNSAWDHAEE